MHCILHAVRTLFESNIAHQSAITCQESEPVQVAHQQINNMEENYVTRICAGMESAVEDTHA